MERESIRVDAVIVGAGPAGLSTAIRLMQLAQENETELSVIIVEKGSEVGAHIISGAVFEPRALNELIPDWKEKGAPLNTAVTQDFFKYLFKDKSFPVPHALLPNVMKNNGNYIISLGNLCRWLAQHAEDMGVEIFPGFAASHLLYTEDNHVAGVAIGDMGITRDGAQGSNYTPGMDIFAKYTFLTEGCHGHLGKQVVKKYDLKKNKDPSVFGIGFKELWEIDPKNHRLGTVMHTAGWPLDNATYGGSFIYHTDNCQVSIGYVVGLNYKNPYMSPFDEFQRLKTHPAIKYLFEGGKRISYGARAINAGGTQALPKMTFPGGFLLGCDAGTLNVPKIKGSHTAMKSGMLAAEVAFKALTDPEYFKPDLTEYEEVFRKSWIYKELYKARNFKPMMSKGLILGSILSGIDQVLFRGNAPWTLHHHAPDHESLKSKSKFDPITYPKPDGKITFDRLSSVFLTNTYHEEDQPIHLQLKDNIIPIQHNLKLYDAPEQRYCPAGVYEIVHTEDVPQLQINAQNCIHCKTCDIKDPKQNIIWIPPEGGSGPNYPNM